MHRNRKPVRKCNGCGLNFWDRCGVFENPHKQWEGRKKCPGYANKELLAEYEAEQVRKRDDPRRNKRKKEARQEHTENHHDGDRHVPIAARQ